MKRQDSDIKAIFFDLWNSLIIGSGRESITEWYRDITRSDSVDYDREECMTIHAEDPQEFLEKFLSAVNDSYSSRLLLSIRDKSSPNNAALVGGFAKRVSEDSASLRWLPGTLEVLHALKGKFIIVGISNIWAYQRPHFRDNLKIDEHFDHVYFSSDHCLEKTALIKKAVSELGLKFDEVLTVGDRYDNDIIPATEMGMRALKINAGVPIDPKQFLNDIMRAVGSQNAKVAQLSLKNREPKKCLFIIPPYYKMFQSHNNRINLGITTLVEICEKEGISTRIFHADASSSETYPTRYQMLLNSANFYERLDDHPIFDEIGRFVKDSGADAVVVTCGDMLNSFTDTGCWQLSKKVAQVARLVKPESYLVSYGPDSGDDLGDFDAVITQEAEADFLRILKERPRGILKTASMSESQLDALPVFKKERFVQDINPKGFDIAYWRRGCLGRCQFCRVYENHKGNERYRSLEKFIEDIGYRYNELGLRNFYFVDPNFTSHKDKALSFCREVEKVFPDISWRAESRFDTLTEEIIANFKEAGCAYLKLGLENALGEDHQTTGKKVSLDNAKEKIQLLHKYGIKCIMYLMLGGYWYTRLDYERMYENAAWLGADGYTISIMTPYVGTGIGVSREEWNKWQFTGSHLDIRLIDYWKIPVDIIQKFYSLELTKGREDKDERKFILNEPDKIRL